MITDFFSFIVQSKYEGLINVAGTSSNKAAGKKKADKAPVETMKGLENVLKREPSLKTTLQQIEKQFGEGSIMPLGGEAQLKIEGISTGSLSLDVALGGVGVPRGRIIEIFGPESSGKTTIALHICAQAQKAGGIASIIDAEHAFDPTWGKKLGVQLDSLLVSQPSSGEEAMQITEMLIKSNAVDVIVIDSVAALVPRQELEGEIGDTHVGLQARLMSQSMRKLTGAIARSKTCVIFINQIREKIGGMSYGSPETTSGGRALKFYASCRIDVRRIGQLKDGEEVVGQRVKTKIVKNKVAPPFRVAEFDMMHNCGISFEGDLLDLGTAHKIVNRSGAWFKYGETYIGQGKEKARNFLMENKAIATEIRDAILACGGYSGPEDSSGSADADEAGDESADS
jgi:recombination protein RecA